MRTRPSRRSSPACAASGRRSSPTRGRRSSRRSRRSRSRSTLRSRSAAGSIERYGVRHEHAWAFPSRETLAEAREEEIVAGGFSRRKAEYVVALARSDLDLAGLAALPDDEVRATITAQRGLGEWTADWFLARHLARPHAWPAGDLALRKAVSVLYGDGRGLTTEEVRRMGERFAPFQNLTAHYVLLAGRTP